MDTLTVATLLVASWMAADPVTAATYSPPSQAATVIVPGYTPHWHHWHSSTAAGAWLHGRADLARAMGWYNYLTSQALVYRQQAAAAAIENSKRSVEVYFERRRINEAVRYPNRRSPSVAHADRPRQEPAAKPAPMLFDAATGQVAWPAGLMGEAFAAGRSGVEALLDAPAETSSAGIARRAAEIRNAVSDLRADLQTNIHRLSPMDYVEARRFLVALAGDSATRGPATGGLIANNP